MAEDNTFKDYVLQSLERRHIPKDEYGHKAFLLSPDSKDPAKFADLCNKDILQANISSNDILRLYQKDVGFLVNFFDMAQEDEAARLLFNVLYNTWKGELALTRVKDGTERKLQAESNNQAYQTIHGVGDDVGQQENKKTIRERLGGLGYG